MTTRRLKDFLLNWVVPPGLEAARQRRLIPQTQKFWNGTPVSAPQFETAYFAAAGAEAATITRNDDSRTATRVEGHLSLAIPVDAEGQAVQLALAAEGHEPSGEITLTIGDQVAKQTRLRPGHWLDVRLDVPPTARSIELDAETPVQVSFPRAVRLGPSPGDGIRHVLVLVLDAMTPRLGGTEHPSLPGVALTPNIDRFFDGGFYAPFGYAAGEWTLPTTASFFTGLFTSRHRVYHPTLDMALPADRSLLAETFQSAGYHTMCLSTANRLTPAFGSHRGFDRFIYHWPYEGYTRRDYDPAVWVSEVTGHLAMHRNDRTFTYVQFPDTHPAWEVPPLTRSFNLGRRGDSTGHDLAALSKLTNGGEQGHQLNLLRLHELDRLLGGLFHFIEQYIDDQTLVVLTADHGTPWRPIRRNAPNDEPTLVDDRTLVTLRMRGPGVPERTLDGLTAPTVDLAPTLLQFAELPVPNDVDGHNLLDPGYQLDHAITESLYGGIYELAVHDKKRTLIEKFPMSDSPVRLSGKAVYRRAFPVPTTDYNRPLDDACDDLVQIARDHRARVGLTEPAA